MLASGAEPPLLELLPLDAAADDDDELEELPADAPVLLALLVAAALLVEVLEPVDELVPGVAEPLPASVSFPRPGRAPLQAMFPTRPATLTC